MRGEAEMNWIPDPIHHPSKRQEVYVLERLNQKCSKSSLIIVNRGI